MGTYEWLGLGWLWKNKQGKYMAHCDNCNKDVQIKNHYPGVEYESYDCPICGEEVLGD